MFAFERCALIVDVVLSVLFLAGGQIRLGGDAGGVENQRDVAVAQDRRAGQAGAALDVAAQRLDDDFFRVDDLVDDQAVAAVAGFDHDDVHRPRAGRRSFATARQT